MILPVGTKIVTQTPIAGSQRACHLIRLLVSGITALREGQVPVRVDAPHRERLLAIHSGSSRHRRLAGWI